MSVSESTINNPKKQLEFYKDLSEQLQQENKQLKEKLKQRDDVIDEAIKYLNSGYLINTKELKNMLKKYKGDNK